MHMEKKNKLKKSTIKQIKGEILKEFLQRNLKN